MTKNIYKFTVYRKETKEVTEKQEDGSKLIKTEEVLTPKNVVLKLPSRTETEEADSIYAEYWGKYIRRGFLTRALVDKMYGNEKGYMSQPEIEDYISNLNELVNVREEYQVIHSKEKKKLSAEDEKRLTELKAQFATLQDRIQQHENKSNNLYANTAETKAQSKQVAWFTLFLSYLEEDDGKLVPVIDGEDFEERLENFDKLFEEETEDNIFTRKAIKKAGTFISIWAMNNISAEEDFQMIEEKWNAENGEEKPKEK